jgi:hypothetical protein
MSTTHGAVKTRCHGDTTDDVYLVGAGCVVCAQVRMGLGSGSKVWNPGTWIRCVLQHVHMRLVRTLNMIWCVIEVVVSIPSSAYFFVFGVGNFTDPCLMSTCHELHGNTTNILYNLFHRTFHAIPMVESEACECQVNDYLICFGFTSSSFFKFGRAELPNFCC